MFRVDIYKRLVERGNQEYARAHGSCIISMHKKLIGRFLFDAIPRKDDTIKIDGKYFIVKDVILDMEGSDPNGIEYPKHNNTIIEVINDKSFKLCTVGSDTYGEVWPPITELNDEF